MTRTGLVVALLASALSAQQPNLFASRVVAANTNGNAGGGIFQPSNALGAPDGTFGVHSLGIGGSLTLGFDVVITDGPGADLLIAENPFFSGPLGDSFAEVVFVEVSSNGVDFARVPSRYDGPSSNPGAFGTVNVGWYGGLGGAIPVDASTTRPRDPVRSGGDAIDLATLVSHPLVTSGRVDLDAITEVRLVDVRSGVDVDARGITIFDPGSGSADIDAVTVLHPAGLATGNEPAVAVDVPPSGAFSLTVADVDGVGDLDPSSWRIALWGYDVPIVDLLPSLVATNATATSFTLRLAGSLPPGFTLHVASSIEDFGGGLGADAGVRPLN